MIVHIFDKSTAICGAAAYCPFSFSARLSNSNSLVSARLYRVLRIAQYYLYSAGTHFTDWTGGLPVNKLSKIDLAKQAAEQTVSVIDSVFHFFNS